MPRFMPDAKKNQRVYLAGFRIVFENNGSYARRRRPANPNPASPKNTNEPGSGTALAKEIVPGPVMPL